MQKKKIDLILGWAQGRIIHRRDWASALGHQPIGGTKFEPLQMCSHPRALNF